MEPLHQRVSQQARYIDEAMPLQLIWRMMCGNTEHGWHYRTLGFSKPGYRGGLIWWRDKQAEVIDYESFVHHLRDYVAEQLHLGSLHCSWDRHHRAQRRLHEVVLDIDLTDYKRHCACATAKERKACSQCWLHIEGTVLVLRHRLTHELGVPEKHVLWVYSGKKGVHCLVNDPRLMALDAEARQRLVTLLSRPTAQQQRQFAAQLPTEVAQELEQLFLQRCIQHRQLLLQPSFRAACLLLLKQHYPALHAPLFLAWSQPRGSHDSREDWDTLLRLQLAQSSSQQVPASLLIALQCYYPVIDPGPLALEHLYKAPFSVHADTGRLALPMRWERLMSDNELPLGTLDRASLLRYTEENAGALPEAFTEACELFEAWLSAYQCST